MRAAFQGGRFAYLKTSLTCSPAAPFETQLKRWVSSRSLFDKHRFLHRSTREQSCAAPSACAARPRSSLSTPSAVAASFLRWTVGGGNRPWAREFSTETDHSDWEAAKASIEGQGYSELQEVLDLVEEKKATNINVLSASDIQKMGQLCEHMVVVTCMGQRHMRVVAEHVAEHFKLKGMLLEDEGAGGGTRMSPPKPEGLESDEWILLDLRNIILHIFSEHGRHKYALEEFWATMAAGGYTPEEIERMKEGPAFVEGEAEEDLTRDEEARARRG